MERPLSGATQTLSLMTLWSLLATGQVAAIAVWLVYFKNIDAREGDTTVSNLAVIWLLLAFLGPSLVCC